MSVVQAGFADGFWIFMPCVVWLWLLQKRTRFVALPDEIIAWPKTLFLCRRRWKDDRAAARGCSKHACQRARRCRLVRSPQGPVVGRFPRLRAGGKTTCCRSPVAAAAASFLSCPVLVLPPATGTGASSNCFFFFCWCAVRSVCKALALPCLLVVRLYSLDVRR